MTAAERYRQLEISPSVQVARWIFTNRLNKASTVPLREVVEDIKTGKTPPKEEKKYYENGILDWFKPSEIGEGKYLTSAKDKVSQLAIDAKQATIYQPGTLLVIGIGAGIGRLAITKDFASSNQQITGLAFNKLVLPEYAYYYFLAFREFFYVDASKSTIPIINQKKITSMPFILCDVDEQKWTTDFLSAIESITHPQEVERLNGLVSDGELIEATKRIFAIHFASATLVAEFDKQELHLTQLRQALLREAMQGQLLPQDPTDEPAAVLLRQLQAEKARLGKGGKGKVLFSEGIEVVKGPFEIPESWVWCMFVDVADIESNLVSPFDYPNHPHVAPDNIEKHTGRLLEYLTVKEDDVISSNHLFVPGQLIYSKVRPKLNKVVKVDFTGLCSADMYPIKPLIDIDFLHRCMLSGYFLTEVDKFDNRVKMPKLNQNQLSQIPIPLPPLAEQHRIVAKLEQLLGHCDALEQRIRESRRLAEQLLQTALREALAPPAGVAAVELEELVAEAAPEAAPRRRGSPAKPGFQKGDVLDFGDLFSQEV